MPINTRVAKMYNAIQQSTIVSIACTVSYLTKRTSPSFLCFSQVMCGIHLCCNTRWEHVQFINFSWPSYEECEEWPDKSVIPYIQIQVIPGRTWVKKIFASIFFIVCKIYENKWNLRAKLCGIAILIDFLCAILSKSQCQVFDRFLTAA